MKKNLYTSLSILALLIFSFFASFAQEEQQQPKPELFFISIEDWYAMISNLDYDASTILSEKAENIKSISYPDTHGDSARYRMGWILSNDLGTIEVNYWGFSNEDEIVRTDPGSFVFTENLAFPQYAGVFDDGKADGFTGHSRFAVRSTSLLFTRKLAMGENAEMHWRIGARKVSYKHRFNTEYLSLAPALLDPLPPEGFSPENDRVWELSSLEARGIETGASIIFPIAARVSIGSDIGFSYLKGRSRADYTSKTFYYAAGGGGYFNPRDKSISENDTQEEYVIASSERNIDSHVQIMEANVKVNVNVWRTMDVTVGYALSLWNGAFVRKRVSLVETYPGTYSQVSSTLRDDLTFEGFFAALSYRY